MALDVGFKRIGVALSDPLLLTASPYRVIYRKSNRETFNELLRVIDEKKVNKVIIGLPINREGERSKIALKIEKFARKFEDFLKEKGKSIEIVFRDESFTTLEAKELARELKKGEGEVDHIAAALLLKDYLEELQRKKQ